MFISNKGFVFALFLIAYSVFYALVPEMGIISSIFFGAGFGIMIALIKDN